MKRNVNVFTKPSANFRQVPENNQGVKFPIDRKLISGLVIINKVSQPVSLKTANWIMP